MVMPRKPPLKQAVRDFPRCGINKPETKPMKNLQKVNSNPGDVKELRINKSYLGSKKTPKVKFWDPACEVQKPEDNSVVVSPNERMKREKIQHAMAVFDQVHEPFYEANKKKPMNERVPPCMVPMEVAKIVRRKLKWIDPGKIVGPVCGVRIGDKFKYRSQLMMIGVHCQQLSGIDYVNVNGKNVAISIVDAHRYSNESGSSDSLVYSGQGGHGLFGAKSPPEDQKLERGNLALKNSMYNKTWVRVIRKVGAFGRDVFVYDGLYIVDHYAQEKSAKGKTVFKFHLKRVPGQPSLHKMMKW